MRPAVARLAFFSVLFVIWLGYLFYLKQMGKPIVLSRPQFLVSQYDVIATIVDTDKVKIDEVLFPKDREAVKLEANGAIKVVNLESCKSAAPESKKDMDFTAESKGNTFLLALRKVGDDTYEVAPTSNLSRFGPPRIYPATEQVRADYKQIRK